jgi:hypothetical protein
VPESIRVFSRTAFELVFFAPDSGSWQQEGRSREAISSEQAGIEFFILGHLAVMEPVLAGALLHELATTRYPMEGLRVVSGRIFNARSIKTDLFVYFRLRQRIL